MNSFLSTSLKKHAAKHFIGDPDSMVSEVDKVRVMFEIEADPHLPGGVKPFARLDTSNNPESEAEVLFMAGSIFKIVEVNHGGTFPTIKMELCSNEVNQLKPIFDTLCSEYGGQEAGKENEASLNSLGIIVYNMDMFDTANRFFRRIYLESDDNDPSRARYCQNIGNVAFQCGQYEESARWYDQALHIYQTNGTLDHPALGNLYLVKGNLYSRMKKRREALEWYERAIDIYRANFGDNYPKIALCYCNMARHFERRKYYRTSLEYRQRALAIAQNTLPATHPDLVYYHLNLAVLLFELRDRDLDLSLHHATTALRIAETVEPPEHPIFSGIYATLGQIYELMKDFDQSTIWYNKLDNLGGMKSADVNVERVWARRTQFTCTRCHRRTWVYRSFECMKDTRLNCLIFHRLGFLLLDLVRYCSHY